MTLHRLSLHRCAEAGDVDGIKTLLAGGRDPNERDEYGSTPLHCAANKGRIEAAVHLIAADASLDAVGQQGWTAMHFAANKGHLEVLRVLAESGADPRLADRQGNTPENIARSRGRSAALAYLTALPARSDERTSLDRPQKHQEAASPESWPALPHQARRNLPPSSGAVVGDHGILEAIVRRYEVLRLAGEGAAGRVFLARDRSLDRLVAIKELLSSQSSAESAAHTRFVNDARILAQLAHPNIVSVFDLIADRYIVMEYMDGGSLREELQRGLLTVERAIEVATAVLRGLSTAHERGIIHRDVKPENVLLAGPAIVKLTDFGVAHAPSLGRLTLHSGMRELHPGTLIYMSPEQLRGESLAPRSDIYSAGIVLHEMLSGEHYIPPAHRANIAAIVTAVQQKRPRPLSSLFGRVPRKLDRIIDRLTAKQPESRYQSCTEVLAALADV